MTEKLERVGMGFLLLWLMVNVVGWAATELVWTTLNALTRQLLPGYLAGFIAGAVIGTMQWIVFRHYLMKSKRWIVANTVGWGIGLVGVLMLMGIIGKYGLAIGAAFTGASVGLAQWFVLRSLLPRSALLIAIYTIALAYCIPIGFSGSIAVLNWSGVGTWSGLGIRMGMMALGGGLYGVISGFALMLLLERALWKRTKPAN